MEVGAITEILGRLVRDGDFLDDGPLRIVLAGLAVAFVDVVVDPSFRQSLTDIFGQGSPRRVGLLATSKEEFDLHTELIRTLSTTHGEDTVWND